MSLFQRATASSQDRADVFALGDRAALLHHLDQAAIIPHVADSEGRKYPYEVRFGLRQAAHLLGEVCHCCLVKRVGDGSSSVHLALQFPSNVAVLRGTVTGKRGF